MITSPQNLTASFVMCDCAEGKIQVFRKGMSRPDEVPTGLEVHDCEYIRARNALEGEAKALAGDENEPGFTRKFLKAMDQLARFRGLIK